MLYHIIPTFTKYNQFFFPHIHLIKIPQKAFFVRFKHNHICNSPTSGTHWHHVQHLYAAGQKNLAVQQTKRCTCCQLACENAIQSR